MTASSDVLSQIDVQLSRLLSTRAVFPYMRKDLVGARRLRTAPFDLRRGFGITFMFAEPLTAKRIDEINKIGHWIKQNYIVRLYALLDGHKVVFQKGRINTELDGHEEIDILRRLRNEFAHTAGRYDPEDPEEKQLRDRIIEHFSLNAEDHPESDGEFPIPIDKVLVPLTAGCKRYVKALCRCKGRAA